MPKISATYFMSQKLGRKPILKVNNFYSLQNNNIPLKQILQRHGKLNIAKDLLLQI